MINWLRSKWYARCRRVDLEILWPICKTEAMADWQRRHREDDLDQILMNARIAFWLHCSLDPAWLWIGEEATWDFIQELE